MASRISQRSRRSSHSFSRLTWKRAMGIAAEARIATIATQMMSSTRVRPDSGWGESRKIGEPTFCDETAKDWAPVAEARPVKMTVFLALPGCGLVLVLTAD